MKFRNGVTPLAAGLFVSLLAALLMPQMSWAAAKRRSEVFAKIDGLECHGGSTDQNFVNQIIVRGFAETLANTPAASLGGGGGTGRLSVQPLTIIKDFDVCTPIPLQGSRHGHAFPGGHH